MRFLLLTQYYLPEVGAAQVRLAAFARELVSAGHDVEVVTALPNYPSGNLRPEDRWRLSRREIIEGVPVQRLWLYPAKGAGMRRLLSYLSFTLTCLVGGLTARRPDVVFVESPPLFLGVTGWVVAKRFGARFVLNVSDLWPDSVRDMGVMRSGPWLHLAERLEGWLYRRASAVTAVTEGIRDRIISAKGLSSKKVLFLPNGVDTTVYHPAEYSRQPATPRPAVVYIGTHGLAHGLDVIFGAAAKAPDIDFILVGDGTEKNRLRTAAGDRGLANLHLRDPVEPSGVAAIYAQAVAGLSTLRRSDFMQGVRPAKVLAIMACGRPVIYAGAGEGAEIVREADAGLVVAAEDAEALAAAARAIVADPARAAEMGANGRRYVEAHLAWPTLVQDWLRQLAARIPETEA